MRFLPDAALYARTDACLAYLREPVPAAGPAARAPWRCPLYWSGRFARKQAFALKSFLATQDLGRAELWLWLEAERGYPEHAANPFLRPLLPFVRVRPFRAAAELAGTPLEGCRALYEGVDPVRLSNLVRSVVLFKYGGIYADMDTMFLRDLGGLLDDPRFSHEFCYRWSAHQPYANSALLGLRQGSETARGLLPLCAKLGSCGPRDVLRFEVAQALDLLVLPCAFFDPLWPHRDGRDRCAVAPFARFEGFFRPFGWRFRPDPAVTSYRSFFPGAFTYHWHNGWEAREHDESYFGRFDREFDEIVRSRLGVGAAAGRR